MIRFLLVEDDDKQRESMLKVLQKDFSDYKSYAVPNLEAAKQKIQELPSVSLIIADYKLDDGNGYDVLKYCQENLTSIPLILITGCNKEDGVSPELSFQKGVFDFVRKPVDFGELKERIKRALEVSMGTYTIQ